MSFINEGIAGMAGTQNRGSSGGQTQTGMSYQPQDVAAVNGQMSNLKGNVGDQNSFLSSLQQQFSAPQQAFNYGYSTNANQNTNFATPQFTNGLNPIGQAMQSQGIQNNMATQQAANNQNNQTFRNNPALAQILNNQNASQTQLNNNPLGFQAKMGQDQVGINQANAINSAISQANNASLNQAGFQNQGIGQYNQALGNNLQTAAGMGQQGVSNNANLLQQLQSLAQMYGSQNQNQTQGNAAEKAGWFGYT